MCSLWTKRPCWSSTRRARSSIFCPPQSSALPDECLRRLYFRGVGRSLAHIRSASGVAPSNRAPRSSTCLNTTPVVNGRGHQSRRLVPSSRATDSCLAPWSRTRFDCTAKCSNGDSSLRELLARTLKLLVLNARIRCLATLTPNRSSHEVHR